MNKIYLTGSIEHNPTDRFSFNVNPKLRELDDTDTIIILGDFPLDADKYELQFLENKQWNTIILRGCQNNYDRIQQMPKIQKYGTTLRRLTIGNKTYETIYLINEPSLLNIHRQQFLTIPGASTSSVSNVCNSFQEAKRYIDKKNNGPVINTEKLKELLLSINSVDTILSYNFPSSIIYQMNVLFDKHYPITRTERFLEVIYLNFHYNLWFTGGYPTDQIWNNKILTLHDTILQVYPKK